MLNVAITGISGYGRTHYEDLLRRRDRGDVRMPLPPQGYETGGSRMGRQNGCASCRESWIHVALLSTA